MVKDEKMKALSINKQKILLEVQTNTDSHFSWSNNQKRWEPSIKKEFYDFDPTLDKISVWLVYCLRIYGSFSLNFGSFLLLKTLPITVIFGHYFQKNGYMSVLLCNTNNFSNNCFIATCTVFIL